MKTESQIKSIVKSNTPQSRALQDLAMLSGPMAKRLESFSEDELYGALDMGEDMMASKHPCYLDTENPLFLALEYSLGSIPKEMMISKKYADKGFRRSVAFYGTNPSDRDHICIRTDRPMEVGLLGAAIHYLGRYIEAKVDSSITNTEDKYLMAKIEMASMYLENNRPLPVEPNKQSNDSSLELPPIYEEADFNDCVSIGNLLHELA